VPEPCFAPNKPADCDDWAIAQRIAAFGPAMPRRIFAKPSSEPAALRRQETFASTVAHELRQPLSAMLAAVGSPRDVDTARRCSAVMQRQLGQMSPVVEDLVDATRRARQSGPAKRRMDLRDVIREPLRTRPATWLVRQATSVRRHEWTDRSDPAMSSCLG
jgi:signal transduction histidine kinase